ncbi:MAG TPA: DUF6401 family natural product biosynthesis protein [Micromonosporaceae bacterium]|nr:DUF6401 family natural product biosynthesis protein [Micromonosporaceae bacterium]
MTTERTAHLTSATAAHADLDQLMAAVGVDGLVAALRSPGLLAAVDQHATAVRESITAAGSVVDATSVSGYARSVLAVVARHGRELPDAATLETLDWSRAEWSLLRLVACCSIAESNGWL